RTLAEGLATGPIVLWDTGTARRQTITPDPDHEVVQLGISPDATWLATGADGPAVQLASLTSGTAITLPMSFPTRRERIDFSADGRHMVAHEGPLSEAIVWDLPELVTHTLPIDSVSEMAFSPDGRMLAAEGEGAIQLWPVAGGPAASLPADRRYK